MTKRILCVVALLLPYSGSAHADIFNFWKSCEERYRDAWEACNDDYNGKCHYLGPEYKPSCKRNRSQDKKMERGYIPVADAEVNATGFRSGQIYYRITNKGRYSIDLVAFHFRVWDCQTPRFSNESCGSYPVSTDGFKTADSFRS